MLLVTMPLYIKMDLQKYLLPYKMKVWRDFSLFDEFGKSVEEICQTSLVNYWLYSKFAKLSHANLLWKAIRQSILKDAIEKCKLKITSL